VSPRAFERSPIQANGEDRFARKMFSLAQAMRRFSLPQVCGCGARGSITLEPRPRALTDDFDPQAAIVEAEGSFRLDGQGGIVCGRCGEHTR